VDHLPFGAYPVDVLRAAGGWDERLTANEDFELDYRLRQAGLRLLFDPRLVIHWHCRQSLPDLFRQYQRYGRGKVDVALLHPGSLAPRHLAPPLFVAYATAALGLGTRSPRLLAAMLAPYAVAVAVESARLSRRLASPAERVRVPGAIVAMHVGWGVGVWSGLARRLVSLG
jgi:cellulose synthase/poly-beta-1,6-N-acetylglucosamine synthase-like glycosyltransferase